MPLLRNQLNFALPRSLLMLRGLKATLLEETQAAGRHWDGLRRDADSHE